MDANIIGISNFKSICTMFFGNSVVLKNWVIIAFKPVTLTK